MSDSSRSTDDAPGNAERLLRALGGAAAELGTREALTEIGDRARGIVEELARHTRARRQPTSASEEAADASAPFARRRPTAPDAAPEAPLPELHERLRELRACVGEVADVLEATVERLETVEVQLGDPDQSIERQLTDGIERCERVLQGIEHRVVRAIDSLPSETGQRVEAPTVLVVAQSSRRRADLCVALERQGLRALAAADLAHAVRMTACHAPSVALVEIRDRPESGVEFLEEWKEYQEHGALPGAAVLDTGADVDASAFGFETINEEHGEAAMAACLARVARVHRPGASATHGHEEERA